MRSASDRRPTFDEIRARQMLAYRIPGRDDDESKGFRQGQVCLCADGFYQADSVARGAASWTKIPD